MYKSRSESKLSEPHMINLDNQYGLQIYQKRLQYKRSNNQSIILPTKEADNEQILGVAGFLNQLYGDAVITNPQTGAKCVINHNVDPKTCHLISGGIYLHICISLISSYVKKGDRVGVLGAGIGLLPTVIAMITRNLTVCYEPYKNFHSLILKNANLNEVDIQLEANALDVFNIKPSINTLIVDLSKQQNNLFNYKDLNNLKTIVLFKSTICLNEKNIAKSISVIIKNGFVMDTLVKGVYVFIREK